MNVHLTSTPEFSQTVLKEVVLLLNQTPGEMEFIFGKPLTINQFGLAHPKFKAPDEIEFLTFDEFYDLCKTYRTFKEIPDDEFVIMVTSIKNHKKWFSAFNARNIFVHGVEWEYYTKRDAKFGISYQVVENIFQSQIELNIAPAVNDPNIHMESIGCINDMCQKKTDVMLKLRTADICESCLNRAEEKKVNPVVLEQISRIIGNLRVEFVNSIRIKSFVNPENVYIDSEREVKIGEKNIDLPPLNKVLFIFFLKNLQGIETKLVCNYEEDLYNIYKEIRDNPDYISIKSMFEIGPNASPTFKIVKSKLNKALLDQLGGKLAEFYIIDRVVIKDGINKYKINLEQEYVSIEQPIRKH